MSNFAQEVGPEDPGPEARDVPEVHLKVGEREFHTKLDTLTDGSDYFAAMFSGPWKEKHSNPGDPIFIDEDPDLFAHLLRFLRTRLFPLFWTWTDGFDFALYQALEGQARRFQIEELASWISKKKYVQAVKLRYTMHEAEPSNAPLRLVSGRNDTHGNIQRDVYPQWVTEKQYVCPKCLHDGNRQGCGRKCHNAKVEGRPDEEDVMVLRRLVCESEVLFDEKSCMLDSII